MSGWSWSMVPQRLMSLDAFFELTTEERMVLLMLYMRCDRWGRGPSGSRALGVLIGVEAAVAKAALPVLERAGLVEVDPGGWWQLVAYDEDAPAELIRRRGASQYGATPAKVPTDSGPGPAKPPPNSGPTPDEVRTNAGPTPDQLRQDSGGLRPKAALDETRRDETETQRPEGGLVDIPARAHEAPSVPAPPPRRPSPLDLSAESRHHGPTEPAEWPDEACKQAGVAWYAKLNECRPYGHGFTLDDVKRVAMQHPETFAEAAGDMVAGAKGWTGRGDVIAWLRRQCDFVAERRADQEAKRRKSQDEKRKTPIASNWNGSVYKPFDPSKYPSRLTPEELAVSAEEAF